MPSKKIDGVETSWYESSAVDCLTEDLKRISLEALEAELKARTKQVGNIAKKASKVE